MSEAREVEIEPRRYDEFEDEIELMDYLKVLWKWKYLILVGTLVCAIGAAVVSLNMTKVYGITTVLEPGMLKVTDDGKTVYIDSPQNIKAVIETGAFNGQILKNIKFPNPNKEDVPDSVRCKVTIPKVTHALEVVYETPHVDVGLQIVKNLNKLLLERYGKLMKYYQENYDNAIRSKSNEAFKLNEKTAKVKHAISTAEAENDAAVSEILAKISAKRAEISTAEAENEAAISQILAKISAKRAEISTAEAGHEAGISEILTKISAKRIEISTAEAEKESQVSQIVNEISLKVTAISASESEKDKAIKQRFNREATITAQIEAKKKQILNLGQRTSDVKMEIGRISNNTNLLIEDRNKLLSSTKKDDNILASVMYTNTIQQNISYLNTLRSTINNINHQIFQERVGIEKLENDIKDLDAQEDNLKKQTEYKAENLKSDIKNLVAQKENSVKQTKYRIENLQADIKDLEAQKESSAKQIQYGIENLQANIRDLETQKGSLVKLTKYKSENLQANIKDLVAQKHSLTKQTKYKAETMKSEIKDFENEKKYVLEEIKSMEFKKNSIQNIQIIKSPKPSSSPIKPKTRLNVMLAGVVGLFLTVFLAFFVEYISKYKSREDER